MPRRPKNSSLPGIAEEDDAESARSRSPISLPTEYNQSYRSRNIPRPRNTSGGWQARNISNVLPTTPEPPPEPARPLRHRPQNNPYPTIQTSQIFPPTNNIQAIPNPQGTIDGSTDENNNPETGRPRRRPQWPWQARAQRSSIFYSDAITNPSSLVPYQLSPVAASRSHSSTSRWPWAQRANKSVIFDFLTSKELEKLPNHRKYDWDQRQSTSLSACVHQNENEPSSSKSKKSEAPQWPWKVRAMQSVIFHSPDKPTCSRHLKYVWDQRKSRISVNLNPEEKFPQGSHYSDNYVKWQKVQPDGLKAAGKPCYKEEDVDLDSQKKLRTGKRRVKPNIVEKKRSSDSVISPISALPSPTPLEKTKVNIRETKSANSVRGETCLELVPAGFNFTAEEKDRAKSGSPSTMPVQDNGNTRSN